MVQIRLHEIASGKELIGGIDAFQALSGDTHEVGKAGTGSDEDRLISHLKQFIDGQRLTDDHIGLHINA